MTTLDFTDCLVRPVTDMVRSIGIHIALESPLSTSSIGSTGLIVEIHVSSFYRLAQHDCDSNDLEHPNQDSIEIIYQNHIYLPVDSRNSSRNNFSTLKPSDFIEGEIIFKRYGSFQ